ncbi:FXYD domain-containing ion transport regulator 3 isoform X2 [Microtus ochrogaster]|uniref:FXYD domain-containing ion transport regulator n=1 Tax=Microtus ochrogaster TaxID=79684 RepID=A0ABM1UJE2_MICOH|nr:FXYD domain-containing ion transport regulator 3 isoform X2 [Microtus ochrogaster]
MQEVVLSLLVLLAGLPALDANDPEDKNSPFYYDWYRLRVGGLICAGILCAVGIIVLMSGKCKCKFRQKPSHRPGDGPPLITPGKTLRGRQGMGLGSQVAPGEGICLHWGEGAGEILAN